MVTWKDNGNGESVADLGSSQAYAGPKLHPNDPRSFLYPWSVEADNYELRAQGYASSQDEAQACAEAIMLVLNAKAAQ